MTLKELKHFLRQINVEVDDTYAEEIFKVTFFFPGSQSKHNRMQWPVGEMNVSGCTIPPSNLAEMWQVQLRLFGGVRDQTLLRSAHTPGGDRRDLRAVCRDRRPDELQRSAELPAEWTEGGRVNAGRSEAHWEIRGGWHRYDSVTHRLISCLGYVS